MKKLNILILPIIAFLLFFAGKDAVSASTGSLYLSTSKSTVIVGSSVTVTVTLSSASNLGSWQFDVYYDTSKLKLTSSSFGGTHIVDYGNGSKKSASYTFTFAATASGTARVYTANASAYDFDLGVMSVSNGSISLTQLTQAQLQATYSSNNNLSSLKVDGFNIDPAFDKDKLEYSLTVDNLVEKINITAVPADTTAVITGNGERVVSEGENKLEVNVTAQNGAVKKYIINVNVKELNPIVIRIDDKDYNLVRKKSVLEPPKTYSETTVTIKDTEIPAFKSDITGYTLVGLKDSEGKIKLYIYSKSKESYTEYNETEFTKNTLYIMPYDKTLIPDSYKLYTMKIDGENREVYKISKSSKYALLQGMNIETGEEYLYLYDSLEKTVQRFYDEDNKKIEELNKYYLIALASTGSLTLILFISLISKSGKLRKLKRKEKDVITVESNNEEVESNDEEDFLLVNSISSKKNKKSKKK